MHIIEAHAKLLNSVWAIEFANLLSENCSIDNSSALNVDSISHSYVTSCISLQKFQVWHFIDLIWIVIFWILHLIYKCHGLVSLKLVNPKELLFYPCKTFSPGLISGNGFVYEATLHVAVIFKSIPCTMIIIYAIY